MIKVLRHNAPSDRRYGPPEQNKMHVRLADRHHVPYGGQVGLCEIEHSLKSAQSAKMRECRAGAPDAQHLRARPQNAAMDVSVDSAVVFPRSVAHAVVVERGQQSDELAGGEDAQI